MNKAANVLPNQDRVKADALSAELYTHRRPEKHRAEMAMVAAAFTLIPADAVRSALDAPCGVGRMSLWLAQQGFDVTAVDLGDAAVEYTREALQDAGFDANVSTGNLFALDYADSQFDVTLCFRLLHHFEDADLQQKLIAELCRVSSKYVVISYFSPYSVTTLKRRLRKRFTGKAMKQNPTRPELLRQYFAAQGFGQVGKVRRSPLLHSLQLAVFARVN